MSVRPLQRSVIITCAVPASIHVPSQSPYLPITPAQMAAESSAAWQAGAAITPAEAPRQARADNERWGAVVCVLGFTPES